MRLCTKCCHRRTVSPPSSTSLRYISTVTSRFPPLSVPPCACHMCNFDGRQRLAAIVSARLQASHLVSPIMAGHTIDIQCCLPGSLRRQVLYIHADSSRTAAHLVEEVIEVRVILLPVLIAQHLRHVTQHGPQFGRSFMCTVCMPFGQVQL